MVIDERIASSATARIRAASASISTTLRSIAAGRAFDAEPIEARRVANFANLVGITESAARELLQSNRAISQFGLSVETAAMAESIQGTADWQHIAWVDWAKTASRSVTRILRNNRGWGTGFLISDRLLITNHHVIESQDAARNMIAEFSYELNALEMPSQTYKFTLDPAQFFVTDEKDDLDYTVVAIGSPVDHDIPVSQFGSLFLSDSAAKHAIANHVTLIQHPNGDYKLIVFRENRIVHRGDTVLHYLADTEGGASGSPVFNDRFQVVAVHHWGGPHREIVDAQGKPLRHDVNEGIRVSAILSELRLRRESLQAAARTLLQRAIAEPTDSTSRLSAVWTTEPFNSADPAEIEDNGRIGMQQEAVRIDHNWENRLGYNPNFLGRNLAIPLPKLQPAQRKVAARLAGIGDEDDGFAIPYHHFSICLNAKRRLPFYTAVNIRGDRWINIDRDTGRVKEESAEAREKWFIDGRIPDSAQCNDDMYLAQKSGQRYFQRGHLVRRLDPTWGSPNLAEYANGDTFHFPNCAPQAQGFNDSKRKWAGIEDYVLYTADHRDDAVSVFTGPIFSDQDPPWNGIRVPLRFYKIVARVESGKLVATALIADQSELAREIIKLQVGGEEAYEDWNSMSTAIREFHRSVAEVEGLTGLDFGPLRAADRPGRSDKPLDEDETNDRVVLRRVLEGAAKPLKKRTLTQKKTRPASRRRKAKKR